jgi:hypothetical protein
MGEELLPMACPVQNLHSTGNAKLTAEGNPLASMLDFNDSSLLPSQCLVMTLHLLLPTQTHCHIENSKSI